MSLRLWWLTVGSVKEDFGGDRHCDVAASMERRRQSESILDMLGEGFRGMRMSGIPLFLAFTNSSSPLLE